MSAFIVSTKHIDALVATAVHGPTGGAGRWQPLHLSFYEAPRDDERTDWDVLGQFLVDANTESVNYRYDDNAEPAPYLALTLHSKRVSIVQALKALRCYVYQSCEHPNWERTHVKAFCDALTAQLINALPGYADAAWEIN